MAQTPNRAAAELVERCGPSVLFLRHRRRHTQQTSPAHLYDLRHGEGLVRVLAIAATGVYVVQVHDQPDAAVHLHRAPGPERRLTEELDLGRTDTAALLDDLGRQVAAVRAALADSAHSAAHTTVLGLLCLSLPPAALLGTPTVGGVPLLDLAGTARILRTHGLRDATARRALYDHLDERLPAA
jgi:hypothetical protein